MIDQRELFEHWINEHAKFYRLYRRSDGSYASEATASAWIVWRGCVAANEPGHRDDEDE